MKVFGGIGLRDTQVLLIDKGHGKAGLIQKHPLQGGYRIILCGQSQCYFLPGLHVHDPQPPLLIDGATKSGTKGYGDSLHYSRRVLHDSNASREEGAGGSKTGISKKITIH